MCTCKTKDEYPNPARTYLFRGNHHSSVLTSVIEILQKTILYISSDSLQGVGQISARECYKTKN